VAQQCEHVVVIGASAGGIETISSVLAGIRAPLPAPVLVVVHMPPAGGLRLAQILGHSCVMPVASAVDGEPLVPGRVSVAVGDRHLEVDDHAVRVVTGPRANGHRPSVDRLFQSAALHHGERTLAVVLSGMLSDGTAGAHAVHRAGGTVIAQDPGDALYASMPRSVIEYVGADHVVAASEIGPLLERLTGAGDVAAPGPPSPGGIRSDRGEGSNTLVDDGERRVPSQWPCPDCGGVLWTIDDGGVHELRCRVGHTWWPDQLLDLQRTAVEDALWSALRTLEDRAALAQRLADRSVEGGRPIGARQFDESAVESRRHAAVIRALLEGGAPSG
jgi:two-component system, chemotaxis family, protein-glutamate methylesterase/glutaminase